VPHTRAYRIDCGLWDKSAITNAQGNSMITEPDRCPQCGANLAIVGRLHLCRKDARLGGAVDRRGLGLGKALERPKPRLVEPANKAANSPANSANRAANRPANRPANSANRPGPKTKMDYKRKMDRKLYQRELMRARRAAARAQQGEPGDKAGGAPPG
jgi:hypothetical protein